MSVRIMAFEIWHAVSDWAIWLAGVAILGVTWVLRHVLTNDQRLTIIETKFDNMTGNLSELKGVTQTGIDGIHRRIDDLIKEIR